MDTYRVPTQFLKALAHPARLRILNALRDDEECVCHLTALLKQRQAYVSQQLMYLRQAGLIEDRKDGLRVYYRIKEPRVLKLLDVVNPVSGDYPMSVKETAKMDCPCPKCQTHGGEREGEYGNQVIEHSGRVKEVKNEHRKKRDLSGRARDARAAGHRIRRG